MHSIGFDGKVTHPRETIFPILKIVPGNRYELIGTGFYIGNNGLFATAKHVIEDVLDEDGNLKYELKTIHFTEDDKYVVRELDVFSVHPKADVCVGLLKGILFKDPKSILQNNYSAIGERTPKLGDKLITYCYPETTIDYEEEQTIDVNPTIYSGFVSEVFPEGRDIVMLPSACYRVDMEIVGGASGGPVFDEYGFVVAINSTSYEDTNITFVSCIKDIFNLNVFGSVKHRDPSYVKDLINKI